MSGARLREDDTVEEVAHVMDHDTVLFFSPDGICRALKAYQIPQSSRTAAGTPLTQAGTPCSAPHALSEQDSLMCQATQLTPQQWALLLGVQI